MSRQPTGYYLLDHPNPHGPHFYTGRRARLDVIVMHITAGLESPAHVDDASAEATARYAATVRDRRVSWHSGSDTDSWLRLLPASYTAFHCQGYNSRTYGHEISKRTTDWGRMPPAWVAQTLRHAADAVRPVASAHGIPLRWLTKEQVDRGWRGFASHSDLDPGRRSDPGRDFPWVRFLELVANGQQTDTDEGDELMASEAVELLREINAKLERVAHHAAIAAGDAPDKWEPANLRLSDLEAERIGRATARAFRESQQQEGETSEA